jgi:hypothetical protein
MIIILPVKPFCGTGFQPGLKPSRNQKIQNCKGAAVYMPSIQGRDRVCPGKKNFVYVEFYITRYGALPPGGVPRPCRAQDLFLTG